MYCKLDQFVEKCQTRTVPDRSNLTGNALPERLGNAKRNRKGTLRERKKSSVPFSEERVLGNAFLRSTKSSGTQPKMMPRNGG